MALPDLAKIHSPLFRTVSLHNLSRDRTQIPDAHVEGLLKSHKAQLKHERWLKKKIRLGAEHNIYKPRKREAKKLRSGKITESFKLSKSNKPAPAPQEAAADFQHKPREPLAEVVNDSVTASTGDSTVQSDKMATMAAVQEEYRDAQLSNILKCPDCQEVPPNLVEEFSSGDMVCASCGLVVRLCSLVVVDPEHNLICKTGWRQDCRHPV